MLKGDEEGVSVPYAKSCILPIFILSRHWFLLLENFSVPNVDVFNLMYL